MVQNARKTAFWVMPDHKVVVLVFIEPLRLCIPILKRIEGCGPYPAPPASHLLVFRRVLTRLPEGPTACFFRYRDGFGRFGLAQVANFCCQVATFGVNLPRQVARITKIMFVGSHKYSP